MTVLITFIRVYMWQTCIFWACNCYKTRIEWKINSLNRGKKNRDILRYEFRIAIRYKFFVYCNIPIYCDTPNIYAPFPNLWESAWLDLLTWISIGIICSSSLKLLRPSVLELSIAQSMGDYLTNMSKAKSRKYQGIFKVKSQEDTASSVNWSQQLEHKQVPKGMEPSVWKAICPSYFYCLFVYLFVCFFEDLRRFSGISAISRLGSRR